MKIKELIHLLSQFDPELKVMVWAEGDRLDDLSVDESFIDQGFIEINAYEGVIHEEL